MFRLQCNNFNLITWSVNSEGDVIMSSVHQVATPPFGFVSRKCEKKFLDLHCREVFICLAYASPMIGFKRSFQFSPVSLCLLRELNLWFADSLLYFSFLCLLQAISRDKLTSF